MKKETGLLGSLHFIVDFCSYCSVAERFSDFHLQLLPFNNEDKNSHDPTLLQTVIKPSLLLLFGFRGPWRQKLQTAP